MPNLVVIFGAGASSDMLNGDVNICNENYRPPLTSGLFDKRFQYHIDQLNKVVDRIPSIREWVSGGDNLEDYLRNLRKKSEKNPEIQIVLTEILLYLQELFYDISKNFITENDHRAKASNYVAFLRELKDYDITPTLITFNYDLFLDFAFQRVFGHQIANIESYDRFSTKLFKVHGSANWGYPLRSRLQSNYDNISGKAEFFCAQKIKEEIISKNLKPSIVDNDESFFPALSIPVPQDKTFIIKEYEDRIKISLQEATRIVIIGWSASDEYFVELIRDNIRDKSVELVVIGWNDAFSISKKLDFYSPPLELANTFHTTDKRIVQWKSIKTSHKGFSKLLRNNELLAHICSD